MDKLTLILGLCFTLAATAGEVVNYSIYGLDDRQEVADAGLLTQSQAVVVAIPTQFTWKLPLVTPRSVMERFKVCPFDRFAAQPSVGSCTGMHVGDGIILTAGHCVKNNLDCEKFQWAFNYRSDVVGETTQDFELNQIFRCEKIIERDPARDLVLIQVNKGAKKLTAMKIDFNAGVTREVYALGSPLGMPLKFSGIAELKNVEGDHGMASLDVFHGNSGSPVMNKYHQPIGMLISGGEDFSPTNEGCRESLVYDESEGHETIFMLHSLPANFKKLIRRAGRKAK